MRKLLLLLVALLPAAIPQTDPARDNNLGVAYMFQAKYAEAREAFARAGNRVNEGIALLAPESRPCVTAAFTLYSEILDRIEAIDFAVFSQRASVGVGRRLQVFTSGLIRAKRARRSRPGPRGSITQGAA